MNLEYPTPPACTVEEYKEGMKARREFIKNRNPYFTLKKQVEKEDLIEWAKA